MWKIAAIVLLLIFLIADSIYLYRRLKKYWQNASWNRRPGTDCKKWRIGLSSLDIPLKKNDKDSRPPENA